MYCLYLRKSRADLELEAKGEMETLARHKKALLDVAKAMKLPVTQVYEEIVSGETIDARPVVQTLLREVEQGQWKGVLVMEVERLARGDTIDQGIVARAFKIGHAKIITPTKTYDPDNEFDEEYFEFGLFMSRREYKTINRRIQRGRISSANEGKFLGSTPPYGYTKTRITGDKGYTLSINSDEARVVKLIYTMYTQGSGMTVIAAHLDSLGIKPRNRDTWSKSTINDILDNPVYIGKLRWSYRVEQKYIDNGKIKKRRTVNDQPIYVDGLHPPIIGDDLFDNAQAVRKRNTKATTKADLSLKNPLSGIVYCQLCGQMMTRLGANDHTPYSSLRCPNRYCNNVSAPLHMVEKKVLDVTMEWLEMRIIELNAGQIDSDDDMIQLQYKALDTSEVECKKIELQISNTFDLLEQGVYSVDVFTSRNKELSERKAAITNQIERIKETIARYENTKKVKSTQIPQAMSILAMYETLGTIEEKNAVLHALLDRVEYVKTSANTKGKINNDNFEIRIFSKLPE